MNIIDMARAAGWPEFTIANLPGSEDEARLKRFAGIAATAEREACAKVCDELHWPWRMGDESGPKECAAAIRARGTK